MKWIFANEIVRRYLVVNSFDGVLTVLGIIFAEFFAGISDPKLVILPGIGSIIALFVSGSWSAYVAEGSEDARKTKELEKHLLNKLDSPNMIHSRRKRILTVSLVNGLSPAISALFVLLPFLLAASGTFGIELAYYSSMAISAVLLFCLGAFTGHVAKENVLIKGALMLIAGAVIALVFYLLGSAGMLG